MDVSQLGDTWGNYRKMLTTRFEYIYCGLKLHIIRHIRVTEKDVNMMCPENI